MDDEVKVVRIYLKESDHGRRKSLMEEILNILHDQHRVHGVVVFRGIAGFGSKGAVHAADLLRLMVDLPLVIEFYDKPAVVDAAMSLLSDLVPPGHMVQWQAICPNFDAAAT
jgi:PII-like signaling protein